MLFVKADKNKKIIGWPIDEILLRKELVSENVSLPRDITGVDLTHLGYYEVEATLPPKPSTPFHKVGVGIPVWRDGKFERTFIEALKSEKWDDIRKTRNELLHQSDWTQLSDVQLSATKKKAWVKYRQDLRDLIKEDTNPKETVWPTAPA